MEHVLQYLLSTITKETASGDHMPSRYNGDSSILTMYRLFTANMLHFSDYSQPNALHALKGTNN